MVLTIKTCRKNFFVGEIELLYLDWDLAIKGINHNESLFLLLDLVKQSVSHCSTPILSARSQIMNRKTDELCLLICKKGSTKDKLAGIGHVNKKKELGPSLFVLLKRCYWLMRKLSSGQILRNPDYFGNRNPVLSTSLVLIMGGGGFLNKLIIPRS